jgi:AraC family transcriptional regulator, melibiose operon regulatory protein
MAKDHQDDPAAASSRKHDRHFYALDRAIGRFGMRIFTPYTMENAHWHGHVELNFLTGASMTYVVDTDQVEVPEGQLVLFWAGIPHQLTGITAQGDAAAKLTNIYLPFDTFLFMPHIAPLQVALLGGGLALVSSELCGPDQMARWYRDYRSNDVERIEVMKAELNLLLRRALLGDLTYLRAPLSDPGAERTLSSAHIRHVVAMVRYIVENLSQPMTNANVAAVTGLHQNYALSLFSRTMRLPMKKFIIRMRLLRARALLMESGAAITTVAEASGFQSISQFYAHFKTAYGLSPHAMRAKYTQMELR